MGRWGIINVLLGLIVLGLGVEIARTWARALPPVEVAQHAAPPPAAEKHDKAGKRGGEKAGAHAEQAPAMLVATIADKDLFDISRQKPTEEAAARPADVPRETGPPAGVTIAGVRIFGKDREAFVTENGVAKRLRTGDQVGGYTVKTIETAGVVLASPSGDVVTMPLQIEASKPGPAAGKPPGPPRPGQPAAPGGPPGSPAAGIQAASPAAGIQPPKPVPTPTPARPAVAVPPVPGTPANPPGVAPAAQNPQNQNPPPLPTDVRQKLERLKQNSGNSRLGRSRH